MSKTRKPAVEVKPAVFAAGGGDVRFKFADGTSHALSIAEVRAMRDRQIERMIDSEDTAVHLAGLEAQQRHADIEAAHAQAEALHAQKRELDATRAQHLQRATQARQKLPDANALRAELDAIMAETGCNPTAAKAKLKRKYAVSRQGLNKKLSSP